MAHIDKHVAKNGKITYRFKVYRGRDPVTNKQLAPYSMTWEPPATWSAETCDKKAPAEAAKFEQRCRDGKAANTKQTFYVCGKSYIQRCELLGRKHKTILGYKQALDIVNPYIGYMQIGQITPQTLNNMYAKLLDQDSKLHKGHKVSNNTVAKYARFVAAVFSAAYDDGIVPTNPAARSAAPSYKPTDPVYYQPETVIEIAKCLDKEPLKWRTITHLYLITGKRRGEIAGLEWDRVDLDNGILDINKSLLYTPENGIYLETLKENNPQCIKIPTETIELLKKYKTWYENLKSINGDRWEGGNFVFVQDNGLPIHPDSINNWMIKFERRYNLPHIHPHAFRHTMASLLYYNGFDSVTVAGQLNHKRVSTTENYYAHVIQQSRAKASECIADVILRGKNS